MANSLKQPFRLLSFELEVKLSLRPELDFLTKATFIVSQSNTCTALLTDSFFSVKFRNFNKAF